MLRNLCFAALLCCFATAAFGAKTVTITLTGQQGIAISPDFSGLSYESGQVLPDNNGNYMFWPGNLTLQGVYKCLGIRCLRVGGNTVDRIGDQTTHTDVDRLFGFAKAADIRVIYSLQLKNSTAGAAGNALLADYIYNKYRANLKCFTVGNEPNYYIKLDAYEKGYNDYVAAIIAKDPQAVFCGPDAGHKMESWAADFAKTHKGDPHLAIIAHHAYQGGPTESGAKGQDFLLSPDRDAGYQTSYDTWGAVAQKNGFAYRITETNSFNGGGAPGASDAYVSALWVLDYMYWWASHGADGVNFHTTGNRYPAIVPSGDGYTVRPLGYGIKTFDLGGHGKFEALKISNPAGVNLTAYAVDSSDGNRYITLINKEHGTGANDAAVMLESAAGASHGAIIYLTAPKGDVGARDGITLGGSSIDIAGKWSGKWTDIPPAQDARMSFTLPAATAAVVRLGSQAK